MYKVLVLLLVGLLVFTVLSDDAFELNVNGLKTKWRGSFNWFKDGTVYGLFFAKEDSYENTPGHALHIELKKPIVIGENDFKFKFQTNDEVMLSSKDEGTAKLVIRTWTYKFDGKIEAQIEIHKTDKNGKKWDIYGTIEAIQGTYVKGYQD